MSTVSDADGLRQPLAGYGDVQCDGRDVESNVGRQSGDRRLERDDARQLTYLIEQVNMLRAENSELRITVLILSQFNIFRMIHDTVYDIAFTMFLLYS